MPPFTPLGSQVNPLQENIARLRRYAETVGASLPEPGSTLTAGIERHLDEVRRLVQETIAATSSPVRIGVVGEFDAGKSLLLGALIGDAAALPVSHLPTTGNITALSLRTQPGLPATQVSGHTIEWLDRAAAIECLKGLLRAADERARGLPDVDRGTLERLRASAEQGPWREAEAWCRQSWDRCGSPPSPRLRQVLREMAWFARCCSSPAGQALLDKGPRSTPLPQAEVARHALQLPHATNLTQMTFDELPPGPGAAVPNPMTADFLQSALPLVRRLTADVRLPPDLWDVSGDQEGTPFLLLDFPGLGADESGVRDSFLCDRELAEVQTILVVLKGDRIGSDVGAALFTRLQAGRPEGQDLRDNILVGINRFDQLPGGPPERPESVREADLQATAPVLHAALVSASNLTPYPERVVLLSALAALDRLTGAGRSVGADRFLSLAAPALDDWNARAGPAWEKVAGRAATDNPRSLLARQLSEVVADGGLARLRTLLVDHVGRHGLRQLLDRVKDLASRLRKAYEGLPRVSPALTTGARLSIAGIQD
ncbi:MAG TPA: dynamin family protein, partial [Gemmataceae bacterium]|nr:dynamin family protein [Gemmataceae bacterium]